MIITILSLALSAPAFSAPLSCEDAYAALLAPWRRTRAAVATVPEQARVGARYLERRWREAAELPGMKQGLGAAGFALHAVRPAIPAVPGSAAAAERGFVKKGLAGLGQGAESLGRMLVPVPLPARRRNQVQEIFLKPWLNPAHTLSAADEKLLNDTKTLALYRAREEFVRRHPWLPPAKDGAAFVTKFATGSTLLAASGAALMQAKELSENTVLWKDFLDQPSEDENGKMVVQLLVEAPVPHTALRIGNRVYSYGVARMTVSDINEYLARPQDSVSHAGPRASSQRSAGQVAKRYDPLNSLGAAKKATRAFNGALGQLPGVWRDSALGTLNEGVRRSVRVTNLNLDEKEILALRRELEMNTGKVYRNTTFVNDCATMIARALEKHTPLAIPVAIDALPSVTSTYLSVRRALGDERVGPTQQILFNENDSKGFHVARNTLVAMQEAKIALYGAPFNVPQRAYLAATASAEDLQFHTANETRQINAWREEARAGLATELTEVLGDKPAADPAVRALAEETLDRKINERRKQASAALESPVAEFKDIITAQALLENLDEIRADWRRRLGL